MVQENLISQKLRILLVQRRMKNRHLSEATGIAQSTISRITSGKSKQITFEVIEKICEALAIEPRELFTPWEDKGK